MHKDYGTVNLLEERDSLSSHTGTALYPIRKPCGEHCSHCSPVLFKHLMLIFLTKAESGEKKKKKDKSGKMPKHV